MSMNGNYKILSPQMLQEITHNPDKVEVVIFSENHDQGTCANIEKAWHGLHFMLNGNAFPHANSAPLTYVVLGGQEVGNDIGYGPARILGQEQVKAAALALNEISIDHLKTRFFPDQMMASNIYPEIWDEGESALDYVVNAFEKVQALFQRASDQNDAMLLWLD